jgi:membrane associated rhomboid family serine protease
MAWIEQLLAICRNTFLECIRQPVALVALVIGLLLIVLSAMFLHGGIVHLGFNMWALWNTGRLAERFYGNTQLALIYLVAGLAGSMASLFFAARTGVSVGASGAIFGVVGCLLAAIFTKSHKLPPALVTSMRNPGLALLFATTYGAGMPGLKLAVLAYLLVTVLLSIPFLRWRRAQLRTA